MKLYYASRDNLSSRVFGLTFDRMCSAMKGLIWALRIEFTFGKVQWSATIHYGKDER